MYRRYIISSWMLLLGLIWPVASLAEAGATLALAQPHAYAHTTSSPSPGAESLTLWPLHFQNMEDALTYYDELARSGRWFPIDAGPLLGVGDRHQQVVQLREHLRLSGDYSDASLSDGQQDLFDEPLFQALLRFQRRHGAAHVDGVLGPETRRLLNVPPWVRADQLLLNMGRQEALQAVASSRYVQVNIPDYRLWMVADGSVQMEMKAIVGRKSRQTPVFSSQVSALVVNPAWNVPKSIAMRDFLPGWRLDSQFLAKKNLVVLSGWQAPPVVVADADIDMSKMYRGRDYYRLWQPPGPSNALGRIKFSVPNSDSIYLHDTNARQLFNASRRAFSSGCIRLEKPLALAEWLLARETNTNPSKLDRLLGTAQTRHVPLENRVDLHITYWTAWLDDEGTLQFRDDLYRRDEAALQARISYRSQTN